MPRLALALALSLATSCTFQPTAPDLGGLDLQNVDLSGGPSYLDAGVVQAPDGALTPGPAATCLMQLLPAGNPGLGPDYDQFHPTLAPSCRGTDHQDIEGVEKLVFLGDSVTAGTPPTLPTDFYAARLARRVVSRFGLVELATCAGWGAQTDDLLDHDNQIARCFPGGVEPKRTLIVLTVGGNDIADWARQQQPTPMAMANADAVVTQLRQALAWLKDPAHFPNGSFVVFSNVYEYTDATGDLLSCPTAQLSGLAGNYLSGAPAIVHLEEQFLRAAVDTKTDMVFALEAFCGHGYHRDDPASPCYRGPGAEQWFDVTCVHPTPRGHEALADLFEAVIAD